jgi:hypothetical protein
MPLWPKPRCSSFTPDAAAPARPAATRIAPAPVLIGMLLLTSGAHGCGPREDSASGTGAPVADTAVAAATPPSAIPDQPAGGSLGPRSGPAPAPGAAGGGRRVAELDTTEPAGRNWTAGTTRVQRAVSGVSTLRGVRTARHDGYDRIVFEFSAGAVPPYTIRYVDRPVVQCGSGDPIPLPGDGWLAVGFEPARAHDDAGRATVQPRDLTLDLPVLLRLVVTCDFEAHLDWVAAVRSPEPYAVLELRDPPRLVIDVRQRR